jgi:hypothetical protein
MKEPKYVCKECGVAVIIVDGKAIRPCPHKEAAITANMTAIAYGIGGTKNK